MDDDEEWSVDDEEEQEDEESGERDGRDDAMIQYCNSKYIVLWLLYMLFSYVYGGCLQKIIRSMFLLYSLGGNL